MTDKFIPLCNVEQNDTDFNIIENYDSYNRELVLDLTLGSFSYNDLQHNEGPLIRDYMQIPDFYVVADTVNTYNDTTITGTHVVHRAVKRHTDRRRENFKYLTTYDTKIFASEYHDYNFVDWRSIDGVGKTYNAYLIAGYHFTEDMMRKKQSIYLHTFFTRTETHFLDEVGTLANKSSCKIQPQWEWNNSTAQGKWGVPFEAYRLLKKIPATTTVNQPFDYGDTVVITKNKLRGRGRSLAIKYSAGCGEDCILLGWAIDTYANPVG